MCGIAGKKGSANMPTETAFDSEEELRRFTDAGADERLAAALVDHSRETLRGVATKEDIRALEKTTDTSVALLGAEMKTELNWIKIIGVTILALLALPWLTALV